MIRLATLDSIKARLAAAVHPGERWTSWPELTMDNIIMHRVYDDQRRCVAECSSPDVAEVFASAPTDIARLTAAVDAVLGLMADPEHYESQGPHDGYVSVENLRNAIENALKEES